MILIAAMLAVTPPVLPKPDGPYAVGVRRFEMVDTSRAGVAEDAASHPRALPAMVWYPARSSNARPAPYFTPDEAAVRVPSIARNFLFSPADVAGFAAIRTHAVADASPLAAPGKRFPLVVFSHGFYLYANQNEPLAETLASHGYIVVSIDHPRDAVDVRTGDGRIVATNQDGSKNKALFALMGTYFGGRTDDERVAVLPAFKREFDASRMGVSLTAWRDDTLFAVRALRKGSAPAPIRAIVANADQDRLALAGMSFGGATGATTCRLLASCRAILNLDGENFEPALFDGDVERPMLLIHSDWTKHHLIAGQPRDPAFTPNDYAYERWTELGRSGRVLRVRIAGVTHMGLTDLALMMPGRKAIGRFGAADPARVVDIVDKVSLRYLDVYLKHGSRAALDRVVDGTPGLVRHDPARTRAWALARAKAARP